MDDPPIRSLLEALPRARAHPDGTWSARCPAHDDRGPSLGWRYADDGPVLLRCHAGCATEDVVEAVGVTMADLFPPEPWTPPSGPRLVTPTVTTDYPIRDADGTLIATHRRHDHPGHPEHGDKHFAWLDAGGRSGLRGRPAASLPLYGVDLLATWDLTTPVVLTEGEKAADALRAAGKQALATVCGSGAVPEASVLACLTGRPVVLWPDHDRPGDEHMHAIAVQLHGVASSVRWVDPTGWSAKADAADLVAPGMPASRLHAAAIGDGGLEVPETTWAELRRRIIAVPERGHGGHGGTGEHDGGTSSDAHDDEDDGWLAAYGNEVDLRDDLHAAAFHGPIGQFARRVGGVNTLASPASLLVTGLAMFGALCGRGTWRTWNETVTYPTVFALMVGGTGEGKGVSLRVTQRWLSRIQGFDAAMIMSDFTSGEGLIQKLVKLEPDAFVGDTRAIAWAEEFAAVLRAKSRESSTLAQILRRTYDGDLLERNTAKPSGRVEQPAVSLVCHVTPEELRIEASAIDAASGFLNRFLVLPLRGVPVNHPSALDDAVYVELANRLSMAVAIARSHRGPIITTPAAAELLERVDAWRLAVRGRPALVGKMCERIAQNVGRLALAFALSRLETGTPTPVMDAADVLAAIAIGDLSERTVTALWTGTPKDAETARLLHRVTMAGPGGVSLRDVTKALWSNSNRYRGHELIARALDAGILRKVPSGRGFRLFPAMATTDASLWSAVVRDGQGSPIVLDRSPMSPTEEAA